jgi:hypothetical protein
MPIGPSWADTYPGCLDAGGQYDTLEPEASHECTDGDEPQPSVAGALGGRSPRGGGWCRPF